MDTLQLKTLEHILELLQSFESHEIYATMNSAIKPVKDIELKENIMFLCESAINMQTKKIKEAISWIKAMIEKK